MKHITSAIVVFFALLFAYTKLVGPFPFSLTSVTTTKSDSFTVTGEGKVTVVPDMAVLTAGVEAQGSVVGVIQEEINTKTTKITDAIKQLGVKAADIQTSNYAISPIYDYTNGTPRIVRYQANSMLTIHVKQIDKVNAVIDAATVNGANQVGSVSFDVSDKTKAENTAREIAVKVAKSKAQAAARAAGFSLGRVINYSEDTGTSGRPVPMYAKADSAMGMGSPAETQVEPGSSEIVINVTLSYEVR